MPLSAPAPRQHIHTRQIDLRGYERDDGLWDIEAHLTDVKTYPIDNRWRGQLDPGTPIHDMWVRLTIDIGFEIKAIEAVMDSTPYSICGDIAANFQKLVGLKIVPGWTKAIRARVGGVHGCTHLVELMRPLGTVAFQTLYPALERKRRQANAQLANAQLANAQLDDVPHAAANTQDAASATPRQPTPKPPAHLNTCYALSANGEVVRQHYPEWYTGG